MKTLKTKITWCCFMLFVIATGTTQAQGETRAPGVEFGLRFMPAFTKFDINTSTGSKINGDVQLGYGVGAVLGYHFSDYVGIQGELIYSSFAQKYKESDIVRNINLKYINIPLLLALNTGKSKPFNFGVVVGPQIGLNVGSKLFSSNNTNTSNPVLAIKKGDLGFAYGAGLDFGLNPDQSIRLGVGFRGVYGLIDISDRSSTINDESYYILDRTKIKVYSGYAGISFIF